MRRKTEWWLTVPCLLSERESLSHARASGARAAHPAPSASPSQPVASGGNEEREVRVSKVESVDPVCLSSTERERGIESICLEKVEDRSASAVRYRATDAVEEKKRRKERKRQSQKQWTIGNSESALSREREKEREREREAIGRFNHSL